jgi:hypothetical protein
MKEISKDFDQSKQMLVKRLPNPDKPYVEVYAILLRDGKDGEVKPKMIGIIGASRNEPQGAEIWYGLHPDYWGKGYMIEALKVFIGVYWGPGSEFTLLSFFLIAINSNILLRFNCWELELHKYLGA